MGSSKFSIKRNTLLVRSLQAQYATVEREPSFCLPDHPTSSPVDHGNAHPFLARRHPILFYENFPRADGSHTTNCGIVACGELSNRQGENEGERGGSIPLRQHGSCRGCLARPGPLPEGVLPVSMIPTIWYAIEFFVAANRPELEHATTVPDIRWLGVFRFVLPARHV